jgi:RNA polymerase sigma-70 factor (ECF subfamily)
MVPDSDAGVISASIEDPACFGALFDRHASVLFRYLVRRVGVDEAEVLLGEVFRVAFERRLSFDCTQPNARPWLYGIATNLVAHHRRSEARRFHAMARLVASRESSEDPADRVSSALDAEDLLPIVAEAVSQLPDLERAVLLLYVWEELSYEEIATALSVPVGTVRSRLSRGRMRLRELRTSTGKQP